MIVQNSNIVNLGMFNVQVLIIMKKKMGTIRTFIFRSLKIFANVSLPLQKHHQGIQFSHKLHYMEYFII